MYRIYKFVYVRCAFFFTSFSQLLCWRIFSATLTHNGLVNDFMWYVTYITERIHFVSHQLKNVIFCTRISLNSCMRWPSKRKSGPEEINFIKKKKRIVVFSYFNRAVKVHFKYDLKINKFFIRFYQFNICGYYRKWW